MSAYNVDLMLAVREQITSHPETHNQGAWARQTDCGTTYCIAGWACALSGATPLWETTILGVRAYRARTTPRGEASYIEHIARGLLGLTPTEADQLFYAGNSTALDELDELIEKGKNSP